MFDPWPLTRVPKGFSMHLVFIAACVLCVLGACSDDSSTSAPADAAGDALPLPPPALPDIAKGPAIDPAKGYIVSEIRDGLYWYGTGSYICMFLVTPAGVIVADVPKGEDTKLLAAIQSVTNQPVTHIIYSHIHADHIGGAGPFITALGTNPIVIGHQITKDRLVEINDPGRPPPSVVFDTSYTLTVGGKTLQLDYHGPQHIAGNIYIYAPQQKTLMLVDVVYPGWTPFKRFGVAADIRAYIRASDDVLAYDFDTFVGGHLTRNGTRQDVETHKAYVASVIKNAATAASAGGGGGGGLPGGDIDLWAIFNRSLTASADLCASLTASEWSGKLGGVSNFETSHCESIVVE
jgi:glyoxylase-like metal-dependent hydrolase (beta-lactamase superfamily II)